MLLCMPRGGGDRRQQIGDKEIEIGNRKVGDSKECGKRQVDRRQEDSF